MSKQLICLVLVLFVMVKCQYEIDNAYSLLQELESDTRKSIQDLEDSWEQNSGLLRENVQSWQNSLDAQNSECNQRQAVVDDQLSQIEENDNYLNWISSKIRETSNRYNSIYEDRCLANRNYIQGLSNDKVTLKLIQFLRLAVQNYHEGSFIQQKQTMNRIKQFIQLFNNHNFKQLLQMHSEVNQYVNDTYQINQQYSESTRTAEEIGSKHIDEQRDELELDSFENGKREDLSVRQKQLLDLLDELETQVSGKIVQSSEDEMESGIAAAEFRGTLEHELSELDEALYDQVQLKTKLKRQLVEVENHAQQCQIELSGVQTNYDSARTEFEQQESNYQAKLASLNSELELFLFVKETYQNDILNQQYQEQVEDYVQDGSIDEEYNQRKIDQIEGVGF